jgi:hypothetical protein
VRVLGINCTEALMDFFFISEGVPERGVWEGVVLEEESVESSPSSSSIPKESFGVPILRFFFLGSGSLGGGVLYYDYQFGSLASNPLSFRDKNPKVLTRRHLLSTLRRLQVIHAHLSLSAPMPLLVAFENRLDLPIQQSDLQGHLLLFLLERRSDWV